MEWKDRAQDGIIEGNSFKWSGREGNGREEDEAKKRGTEWSTRELNGMVWKGR
jgi:hypothetical protein